MTELILYHIAPSRGSIVLWMLEELGEPYEVRLLDAKAGENRQKPFLALNPMGKVPTLVHDGVVITEAAAICCHLADAFPSAGLAPPIGDPQRGPYLKWLFFGPSCLEPALIDRMHKREMVPRGAAGWGDFELVMQVLRAAVAPGPYLLGQHFTAADAVIGSGLRWGSWIKAIPETPEFGPYMATLSQRPALLRAMAKDQSLRGDPAS